jgi:hypothetical protein
MDPISIGLMAASTAITAIGAIKQGQSANAVAKYNAKLEENNARAAIASSEENARREGRLGRKRQGELRAYGVSMDVLEDSAMGEELNRLTILHGGLRDEGAARNAARLDRARGDAGLTKSIFSASGALLKGGVKAYDRYDELYPKETVT